MSAKLSLLYVAALAALPMTVACGGDDGTVHPVTHDAMMGSNQMDAPVTSNCLANDSYAPTFGADDQFAFEWPDETADAGYPHEILFGAALNADQVPDYLYIDLWQDYGAFTGSDIAIGQYTISGDETKLSSCGTCVYIGADETEDATGEYYVAQGGVLNLTSVSGQLKGTLQNITLVSVDKDEDGDATDNVNGNCQTHIDSASFEVAIEPAPTNATGKPVRVRLGRGRNLHHRYR
jgi:hypothetical protein